jgi:N-acetylglucosamine-6-phosphate deacetylase
MSSLTISNCRVLEKKDSFRTASILIGEGVVSQVNATHSDPGTGQVLDAQGRIAIPGLIDVHIQGAGGADILDGNIESLKTISRVCARTGVTSFLATTVYNPSGSNPHIALAAENVGKDLGGARMLGIHLEGPFINRKKQGGIRSDCICGTSASLLQQILAECKGTLKMMTVAPEIDGALETIRSLVSRRVVASFGHSDADYDQTRAGFDAGIAHVTHLFNAMRGIHHRDPGPIPAIFESDQATAQIIPDGVHLHQSIIRTAYREMGKDRLASITDGVGALGLPDGRYVYNGREYETRDGAARYLDGTLIGTAIGLSGLIGRLADFTNCSMAAAVDTASATPARVIGMERRMGAIKRGMDADVVLLDDDRSVYCTIVGGRIVYQKGTGDA